MKVVKTIPVKAWSPSLQPIDLETRYQLISVGGAVLQCLEKVTGDKTERWLLGTLGLCYSNEQ